MTRFSDFDLSAAPVLAVGLIDPYRLTRECLSSALADLEPDATIFPFDTVENCAAGGGTGFDLTILCLHGTGLSDAATMQKIAAATQLLPNAPLVILTDAEDAQQLKSVYSTLNTQRTMD